MKILRFLLVTAGLFLAQSAWAAGLTVVTHGFQEDLLDPLDHGHSWVEAMGDYVADRAGGTPYIYRLVITYNSFTELVATLTPQNSALPPVEQSQNAEIVIKLYWDQVAGVSPPADSTSIARLAYRSLTNFNHGCELPIQIIGHSRGASVASEMARFLGQQGIWVHQLTLLDPHPWSVATDASVQVWDTVLFADNYYEDWFETQPNGEPVTGAYNENLTSRLLGGYGDPPGTGDHSDVHFWYHGTLNTSLGASDGDQTFTGTMRNTWYTSGEWGGIRAGFYYSRLGAGAYALDGFLFGYNDGGHNWFPDSRTSVIHGGAQWPSLVALTQNASSSIQAGNSFPLEFILQSYNTSCSVTAYLDPDQNPYNGNEIVLVSSPNPNPQPSTGSSTRIIDVNGTVPVATTPGYYYVYAKITNSTGSRYLYARNRVGVTAIGTPAAPAITSVSPSTLVGLPLPQTQLIRIFGSGFTGSSTLLFNGSIASDPTRLYFISASEIDYNIRTDTNAANWTVRAVNGAQQSNLGYFTVVAPSPTTGSLTVNLSPSGAVSAGAQWRVDGGSFFNSGDVAAVLSPGSHTVSFKTVSGYNTPASQNVSVVANQQTNTTGNYTVVTPSNYTLTLNQGGITGYIVNQPFGSGGGNIYNAGAVVQLTANANFGYHFVSWGGDASGTANPTSITMNGNKTVSANFASGDPNLGTMVITIQPPEAAAAGVTWGFNDNDFRASGSSYSFYPETVYVFLHWTNGWGGNGGGWVTLTAGQTTNVTFAMSTTNGSIIGNDPRTYYTVAGLVTNSGSADGIGSSARFNRPWSLAVDKGGNVYVADSWNALIRKISPLGEVTTIAGKAGVNGFADGQGTNAIFSNPTGIAVDSFTNLYVADFLNSIIRKITPDGTVSTFAGQAGINDSVDATGGAARFYFPAGVAVDTNGNVYVADSVNQTIRKITPSQVVTTMAGFPRSFGSVDATGSAARFHNPEDVAVDNLGNVYVADNVNQTVRKVTPAGVVTTLAGFSGSGGTADGTGNTARFSNLSGVAVDGAGNIYVADSGNNCIRKVTQGGVATTLAGQSGPIGSADGIGSLVRFNNPSDVAIDGTGNLFIADAMNFTIRGTQSSATKFDQTITFGTLPDKYINDLPFALTATASSVLPVTFSIVSGPATLSNNVVTLTNAGIVTVRASQSGDSTFNTATNVDRSFVVAKLPQTITFGALSKQVVGDAPFALSASASSGLPVSFSVLSGPVILSGNIVTITGAGLAVLRASQSGDATNAPAPNVDQVLLIVPGNNIITDAQRLANGMFTLRFYGDTGTNYVVKASTNLVNWLPVVTNQISGLGYLEFTDISSTNFARRFYRIAP
jgi:hypothetical protein